MTTVLLTNNMLTFVAVHSTICASSKQTCTVFHINSHFWLIELRSYVPHFRRRSSHPISWLSGEKRKQTQQKQTFIRNKIYYNKKLTQNTKDRFRRLLRPLAWKRKRSVLEGVYR